MWLVRLLVGLIVVVLGLMVAGFLGVPVGLLAATIVDGASVGSTPLMVGAIAASAFLVIMGVLYAVRWRRGLVGLFRGGSRHRLIDLASYAFAVSLMASGVIAAYTLLASTRSDGGVARVNAQASTLAGVLILLPVAVAAVRRVRDGRRAR
jgi:hypothetical protein